MRPSRDRKYQAETGRISGGHNASEDTRSDNRIVRDGAFDSYHDFMRSHGLRTGATGVPNDYEEAKQIVQGYREVDAHARRSSIGNGQQGNAERNSTSDSDRSCLDSDTEPEPSDSEEEYVDQDARGGRDMRYDEESMGSDRQDEDGVDDDDEPCKDSEWDDDDDIEDDYYEDGFNNGDDY
ncbi:hypothetical protein JX265_007474 [Neoarthrinium moseri]|uniref:Uncharacterized protein n=1 Tax=Neoarthrinium moseri TaxID=1658444 RepID=A0A9P9WK93_9PEZI|nr:hypothetical protein JX265_007474 [Neoarthrinium moseri]